MDSATIDRRAARVRKCADHSGDRGVGQDNHREAIFRIDEPVVSVDAAPLPGASRLRATCGQRILEHGHAEAEAPARANGGDGKIPDGVARHYAGGFGFKDFSAPGAQRLQQSQKIACRADHARAAGGIRFRVEDS
jgi:hypothetical protein